MEITNVLVANRGEIARRVFATCRRMGIATTAVYSDADANSPHVAEADAAIRLPGNTPGETYLRAELIIEAALAAGADAIHPGYGFLSENAEFARAVQAAGLTWIGPPVAAIEQMGSKVESKKMMDAAGVPVLKELDPAEVTADMLPVLIKASAGGGGRGMRVVRQLSELTDQIEAAQREAQSAFGDPTVFCERYLETGRHIEVQVMADTHGTVWAVGERECSIQRRHQKVVEEAPSPLVEKIDALRASGSEAAAERNHGEPARRADGQSMRSRLFEAARLASEAIGYEGAGTVEFLADEKGDFFFLEMNTRLQVEHPVTEQVTGLDLVRLQLQVAAGRPLPARQPEMRGHSIEVRLYAEDPAHDWQPQSGPVHKLEIPGTLGEFTVLTEPGVRLDTGVVDGSMVGVHYDPMLSKVISFAETRDEAAHLLASALQRAKIHGLVTNRDLLVRVLRHPAFLAGDTDTAFFATHDLEKLSTPLVSEADEQLSIIAAALSDAAANRRSARVGRGLPSGWRNLPSQAQSKSYESRLTGKREVRYRLTRAGLEVEGHEGLELLEATPDLVVLQVPGARGPVRRRFEIACYGELVAVDSPLGPVAVRRLPRFEDPADQVAEGSLLAPMPGSVIRVAAQVGDRVEKGQPILWLEAMKMEHTIAAPAAGVLTEWNVSAGRQVEVGTVLAVVHGDDAAHSEDQE
ncbi:acetyl/propionyl/methylcrotonyl-CoA carboxylase subunit alpha [Nocardia seriolae]|uniref:acetyl/propionyl/methylcrotonyl-CoA carboxylase subunit alpha n=1 Tax=Nocardia seriolae TaxID=37332 RepID=UPI00051A13C6|nr:biotin carboxylase N-terminal domain-containing protein [Nocardia seriolae]MTJ66652.1 acetyl/propionyl-CoA carboxylase subunit alpha [Nocardia seriolae]MTJ72705.1 acetyl/propionyl-CoA carboxylase subunit alpha [Nocardia seriolae]MTJ85509.1 acetyl/propionyl-CoA carboxylase subunit alpha [Nocardia seriolae]MTK29507.1 acetyl/propionyl-CoA carboxylase subunit alpha [Nocardia seriolae]MTK44584.1 acetyl/propionyl-CoA carboxylase subunit alpha [Nocardia seriolae]